MPELWGILELLGHVRLAGRLSEEERFGGKLGRIDIPQKDGTFVTQFFSSGSIYRVTPCSEEVARAVAFDSVQTPVSLLNLPAPSTPLFDTNRYDDDE